jgi:hypothetical protein
MCRPVCDDLIGNRHKLFSYKGILLPGWQEIETRHRHTYVMVLILLLQATVIAHGASAPSAPREIQAGEVLSQIRDGLPVYYDGVTISGDLNLSGLRKCAKFLCYQKLLPPRMQLRLGDIRLISRIHRHQLWKCYLLENRFPGGIPTSQTHHGEA